MRVEPKVFFANERTFLSYLNMATIVSLMSVAMLNFGVGTAGFVSGTAFTVFALVLIIFATITFQWRAREIRNRGSSGFDDRVGPMLISFGLFGCVATHFVLEIVSRAK